MIGHFNYKPALNWIIVVAIFVFLGKMVWNNWNQVKDTPFALQSFPLVLSTLIFAFSYFIQIWAWYLITLRLKVALSFSDTLQSWFYSQLGKYLPGKVWLLLGRFYFYESKGKSRKEISIALYFEMVTMLLAAGLLFLLSLLFFREMAQGFLRGSFWWISSLFVLAFFFLHPRVLGKIFNQFLFRFQKEPVILSISYFEILWILFICILTWAVGGIGFYLFTDSIIPVSPKHILFLTGALAFSSILGLVAVFAPSGLGVREGVLVYLLSYIMPGPVAVVISVLTRIWMTLIEIGLIGMVYLFHKFQKQEEKKAHGEA